MKKIDLLSALMAFGIGLAVWLYLYSYRTFVYAQAINQQVQAELAK